MIVLGVSLDSHDTGAAIVQNGEIVVAINEERLSRKKMDGSAPIQSVQECLRISNLGGSEIDVLAISGFAPPKNLLGYGLYFVRQHWFSKGANLGLITFPDGSIVSGVKAIIGNVVLMTGLPIFLAAFISGRRQIRSLLAGFKGKVIYVDHHDCHSFGAYLSGPFDECLSVVVEGSDWMNSHVIEHIQNGLVTTLSKTPLPHSAGVFYKLVTMVLGFNSRRHPGKITGLAAYGDPRKWLEKVRSLMWESKGRLYLSPKAYTLQAEYKRTRNLPKYFSGATREDLAAAFQQVLEESVVATVTKALEKTGPLPVILSGGVCANVKMNQKIQEVVGVEKLFVHPAMGDAGQAVGAALTADFRVRKKDHKGSCTPTLLKDAYLGSCYSDQEIQATLDRYSLVAQRPDDLGRDIALKLFAGKVVARFAGRMEYGPRALGNRSILCHCGDPTINDWLNQKLRRTEFMPFAPVTLEEDADRCYIGIDKSRESARFMTVTYDCTEHMKQSCPAVVHVDGTARPQLVSKKSNPLLHHLLSEYKKISGIASLINTSFNMHEEPIVCSPDDAVRAFLDSKIDYLAIGSYLVAGNMQGAIRNEQ